MAGRYTTGLRRDEVSSAMNGECERPSVARERRLQLCSGGPRNCQFARPRAKQWVDAAMCGDGYLARLRLNGSPGDE